MNDSSGAALSGGRLETFLDEAENTAKQQREAAVAADLSRPALAALLHSQVLRADSLDLVSRLYSLWLAAGDPAQALRVLDQDGAAALAALPAQERSDARISLAFWQLEVRRAGGDAAAADAALAAVEQLLASLPAAQQPDRAWGYLASQAADMDAQACVRRCARARQALFLAQPQRAAYRAWDQAVLHLREGTSYGAEGRSEDAHQCALAAIAALTQAGADQDLGYLDWLQLGNLMLKLAPEQLGTVVEQVRAQLPPSASNATRRDAEVQIARLQAQAQAGLGRLDLAIAHGRHGRYSLVRDEDDRFSARLMEWLVQAGELAEAARVAYESVTNTRAASQQYATFLAKEKVETCTMGAPYWALVLAHAAGVDELAQVCGDEDPAAFRRRHLDLAAAQAPQHAAVSASRAVCLLQDGGAAAQALPLLETALREPALASSLNLEHLWRCRALVHGMDAAVQMPLIEPSSAGWCYNLGNALDFSLRQELPEGAAWPEKAVAALVVRHYELGLARYEAFFASGQGSFLDANIHTYSMLCNNLAIQLRAAGRPLQEAVILHRKGLDCSPFAEHHDGLMRCQREAGKDKAGFVAAAESLWNYAQENGYSRHSPDHYIHDVCRALHELARDSEIAIWLERLDSWWDALEMPQRQSSAGSYLGTLAVVLSDLAHTQAEDAALRLRRSLTPIRALKSFGHSRLAAVVLMRSGDPQLALELLQEALPWHNPDDDYDQRYYPVALQNIAECRKALGLEQRPWWRFWS